MESYLKSMNFISLELSPLYDRVISSFYCWYDCFLDSLKECCLSSTGLISPDYAMILSDLTDRGLKTGSGLDAGG